MKHFLSFKNLLNNKLFIIVNSYFVLIIIYFINKNIKKKKCGLVLSSQRFRGEIEILKKDKNFHLITFPDKLLNYLLIPFEDQLVDSNKYYFKML